MAGVFRVDETSTRCRWQKSDFRTLVAETKGSTDNMTPASSRRTAHKLTSTVIGIAAFWWSYWYMGFSEGFNIIITLAVALLAGVATWRLLASRGTDSTTRA